MTVTWGKLLLNYLVCICKSITYIFRMDKRAAMRNALVRLGRSAGMRNALVR